MALNIPPPTPLNPMIQLTLSIFGICMGFSVGLGILFFALRLNYYTKPLWYFGILAIIMLGLIFMMNCFFFRAFVTKANYNSDTDSSAISKITPSEALSIFKTSLFSFFIVIATAIIIYGLPMVPYINDDMNPDVFINIFANTLGYWVVKTPLFSTIAGTESLKDIMNQLFHSNSFDNMYGDANVDFSFLITALDNRKMTAMEELLDKEGLNSANVNSANVNSANVNSANVNSANVNSANVNSANVNLKPFLGPIKYDFCLYKEDDNGIRKKYIEQLKTLVNIKSHVGHYMWMNMSGVVALLVAMIAAITT